MVSVCEGSSNTYLPVSERLPGRGQDQRSGTRRSSSRRTRAGPLVRPFPCVLSTEGRVGALQWFPCTVCRQSKERYATLLISTCKGSGVCDGDFMSPLRQQSWLYTSQCTVPWHLCS